MMKYLQKLGKSLMLPVAVLPVCSILMGIGYWIDPTGWGANSAIAAFLIKAGGSIIDNMGILFAIGVGVGMSEDNDGTGGLAALVSWLMITTLLSPAVVGMLKGIPVEEVAPAFGKIATQFTGILAGLIGSTWLQEIQREQGFLQQPCFLQWKEICCYRYSRNVNRGIAYSVLRMASNLRRISIIW